MSILALLNLALEFVPKTVSAYNTISQVWQENHVPGDPAWEDFKSRFDAAGVALHDTSRDV